MLKITAHNKLKCRHDMELRDYHVDLVTTMLRVVLESEIGAHGQ
jgi:hypothetical protein